MQTVIMENDRWCILKQEKNIIIKNQPSTILFPPIEKLKFNALNAELWRILVKGESLFSLLKAIILYN
jgi:uncharacterized protein (UPF0218 family)